MGSNLFPRWFNRLPLHLAAGLVVSGTLVGAGAWYYLTPKYSRVGYQPIQPVPYSHVTHVEQLGLDCRYCHTAVAQSWYANLPAASVCMNCHSQVLPADPRLAPVRDSFKSGQPVPWVQIHRTPDFVFFNHAVHVNRGVGCVCCHGQINQMVEVRHEKPLTMAFCLECHRDPAPNLRPPDQVYNMHWTNEPARQREMGARFVQEWKIRSSDNCYTCHR
jgi:hypothetical protein